MNEFNIDMLPRELTSEIEGSSFLRITIGESGAKTFLLKNKQNRYLKIMPKILNRSLSGEAEILRWLYGKLPVPEVIAFTEDNENEYLLTGEIKGILSCDPSYKDNMPEIVHLLAEGLKMIHGLNIAGCPFDRSLDVKVKEAEYRVKNGLVNEDKFDAVRMGRKAYDLFRELTATRPSNEELVFTHGDYCLPNIIISNGTISGFIDLGRGGIADRYQDLALAARSLAFNFDEKWIPLLFKEYDIESIDYDRMEFYQLMDEFS